MCYFESIIQIYGVSLILEQCMIPLSCSQMKDYFHRSYTAADGLWFMKTEERYGFDIALDIDNDVWKIMPRIQGRMLKEMGNLGNSIHDLKECIETKLDLERFRFRIEVHDDRSFTVIISECPWHNIMKKAGREELSGQIGKKICTTEFEVLASEFDSSIRSSFESRICTGCLNCILDFRVETKTGENNKETGD